MHVFSADPSTSSKHFHLLLASTVRLGWIDLHQSFRHLGIISTINGQEVLHIIPFTMVPLQTFICILVVISATANAFTTAPIHKLRTSPSPLYQSGPDKGGGAAIATPKTKQATTTVQKQKLKNEQKQKAKPSEPDQLGDFEDAPMYRLFLIGDESYDQQHVVTRVHEVVQNISEDEAARIFKSAYQTGEAFISKFPKEIAETYAEQLTRSDPIIYADVRDDQDKKK